MPIDLVNVGFDGRNNTFTRRSALLYAFIWPESAACQVPIKNYLLEVSISWLHFNEIKELILIVFDYNVVLDQGAA